LKITADTNVMVRILMNESVLESPRATDALRNAEQIVLTLPMLCELVWVLGRGYKMPRAVIVDAIRSITKGETTLVDRAAVQAGLIMMDAGGDFADGIIAFEGRRLGGDIFVTFAKQAAKLIASEGGKVNLLRSD
jgi:predicted nucleic-acid-binding protein